MRKRGRCLGQAGGWRCSRWHQQRKEGGPASLASLPWKRSGACVFHMLGKGSMAPLECQAAALASPRAGVLQRDQESSKETIEVQADAAALCDLNFQSYKSQGN